MWQIRHCSNRNASTGHAAPQKQPEQGNYDGRVTKLSHAKTVIMLHAEETQKSISGGHQAAGLHATSGNKLHMAHLPARQKGMSERCERSYES